MDFFYYFSLCITKEENKDLIKEVTNEEICATLL